MSETLEFLQERVEALRNYLSQAIAERNTLKAELADCHTHLEAQRQQTYQSVEREQALKRQLAEKDRLYHELLYQVGNKYPNESRHETALRYLQRAEQPSNEPAQCKREAQP